LLAHSDAKWPVGLSKRRIAVSLNIGRMPGDATEDIVEPCLRIDAIDFSASDQGIGHLEKYPEEPEPGQRTSPGLGNLAFGRSRAVDPMAKLVIGTDSRPAWRHGGAAARRSNRTRRRML